MQTAKAISMPLPTDNPAGRPIPKDPEAALYPIEVSYLTGKSIRTLDAERLRGTGIPFLKAGSAIRYRRGDVDAYIASNMRRSTVDAANCERRSQFPSIPPGHAAAAKGIDQ